MTFAHSIQLPGKKLLSSHQEPGAHCRMGRVGHVGLQLQKQAFSTLSFLVVAQNTYHRSQRANAFVFHVRAFFLPPKLGFPRNVHC